MPLSVSLAIVMHSEYCDPCRNITQNGDTAMNLVERAKNILLQPNAEWETISKESPAMVDLYRDYIVPLAAIGPLASIIGMSLFGISMPFSGGTYRVPLMSSITHGITSYVLALVAVFVIALIIDALAPVFGGEKNQMQALKTSAYASTPSWLAGIAMLIPMLGIIGLLASLYSLYLVYLGLPVLMKAPKEKAIGYTAVVVVAAIVTMAVFSGISGLFISTPTMTLPGLTPPRS